MPEGSSPKMNPPCSGGTRLIGQSQSPRSTPKKNKMKARTPSRSAKQEAIKHRYKLAVDSAVGAWLSVVVSEAHISPSGGELTPTTPLRGRRPRTPHFGSCTPVHLFQAPVCNRVLKQGLTCPLIQYPTSLDQSVLHIRKESPAADCRHAAAATDLPMPADHGQRAKSYCFGCG